MPKVSVLIPIYNTEKYLKECLNSVINQSLKDIEIICINDGSTDSSLSILNEYKQKDSRIKIISKNNTGYGNSMNIGIENAKGDYIGIVESDDYIEPNMFEILYKKAFEFGVDIIKSKFFYYDSINNINTESEDINCAFDEIIEPLKCLNVFDIAPSIWSCLDKRDFINDNNIRFLETPGASYQDTSFAFKTKACAKTMIIIKEAYLHYRIDNENSSVNSSTKPDFVILEYEEIKRFLVQKGLYKTLKKTVAKNQYNCFCWNFNRLREDLRLNFLQKIAKEYRKNLLSASISCSSIGKKQFLKYIIISLFPSLYYYIKMLHKYLKTYRNNLP